MADWETFGRKICGFFSGLQFRSTIQSMNQTKDDFVLEDDLLYQVLSYRLGEIGPLMQPRSAQDLFSTLVETSKDMHMEGFTKRYKNARSMAKHLANIVSELRQKFDVGIVEESGRRKFYTFRAIGQDKKEEPAAQEITKAIEKPTGEGIEQPTTEDTMAAIVRRIIELQAKNHKAKVLSREQVEDADFKRWEREEKKRQADLEHGEDENLVEETLKNG